MVKMVIKVLIPLLLSLNVMADNKASYDRAIKVVSQQIYNTSGIDRYVKNKTKDYRDYFIPVMVVYKKQLRFRIYKGLRCDINDNNKSLTYFIEF